MAVQRTFTSKKKMALFPPLISLSQSNAKLTLIENKKKKGEEAGMGNGGGGGKKKKSLETKLKPSVTFQSTGAI